MLGRDRCVHRRFSESAVRAPSSFTPALQVTRDSPDWTRTSNPPVNSRMLYQLSYRGRQPRDCSRAFRGLSREGRALRVANVTPCVASPSSASRCSLASSCSLPAGSRPVLASPHSRSGSAPTGSILVPSTACADNRRRARSSRSSAHGESAPRVSSDRGTKRALGARGRPLLGQRELGVGSIGWDVAVLEFRLRRYGLGARAVDGRFTRSTGVALRRYQSRRGLSPDGIAGPKTYRSLAGRGAAGVRDPRRPGTSSSRARASSRSRRATT